jgi:hypothetical protein
MYSEPVCQVTRNRVDVGSFHTRLFIVFIILQRQFGIFWIHPRITSSYFFLIGQIFSKCSI